MKILLINPTRTHSHTGNRTTAERWSKILNELGHQVEVVHDWSGSSQPKDFDSLITLHARRSFHTLERFHHAHPNVPIVVALTGTDLYQDIEKSSEARRSLELASRLVVLQPLAVDALPPRFRSVCRVIYQSAEAVGPPEEPSGNAFRVCVLAHLRAVKDPLLAAHAVRDLASSSHAEVVHAGGVLEDELGSEAELEQQRNPRYHWLRDLPRERALRLLAGSHVLALTSKLEGGANVVSEAIAAGIPVLSTSIPGSIGILGTDYPGYFPVGDVQALSCLIQRAETDAAFYKELKAHIIDLKPLVDPQRERESLRELLAEVNRPAVTVNAN